MWVFESILFVKVIPKNKESAIEAFKQKGFEVLKKFNDGFYIRGSDRKYKKEFHYRFKCRKVTRIPSWANELVLEIYRPKRPYYFRTKAMIHRF